MMWIIPTIITVLATLWLMLKKKTYGDGPDFGALSDFLFGLLIIVSSWCVYGLLT